jgi:hypothetical protein
MKEPTNGTCIHCSQTKVQKFWAIQKTGGGRTAGLYRILMILAKFPPSLTEFSLISTAFWKFRPVESHQILANFVGFLNHEPNRPIDRANLEAWKRTAARARHFQVSRGLLSMAFCLCGIKKPLPGVLVGGKPTWCHPFALACPLGHSFYTALVCNWVRPAYNK